jgi:hypothetical protein
MDAAGSFMDGYMFMYHFLGPGESRQEKKGALRQ